jgi:hypothetical protein
MAPWLAPARARYAFLKPGGWFCAEAGADGAHSSPSDVLKNDRCHLIFEAISGLLRFAEMTCETSNILYTGVRSVLSLQRVTSRGEALLKLPPLNSAGRFDVKVTERAR